MTGRRLRLQNRLTLLIVLAVAPAFIALVMFVWFWDASTAAKAWVLAPTAVGALSAIAAARRGIVRPLQSLANMLEALREGDYSLRGRNVDPEDALGEVMVEVNALSRTLHEQRLEALEAGALLEKIMADVDIAVFAFDADQRLRLVNRAGAALFGQERAELRGRSARELGLHEILRQSSGHIVSHVFPTRAGRWETRRRVIREGGRPHDLLVMSDVSRALREEERLAWQRLVRVIGHELNSSLTPIRSMAATLRKLLGREPPPDDWRNDAASGLQIIQDRAEALSRFMGAYARFARLPPPTRRVTDFGELVRRAVSLYGSQVGVESGLEVRPALDADQMEQVMINLVKNGVEAAGADGYVSVRWAVDGGRLQVEVEDDGPGLAATDNLWVPFFTTKPGGTGLGLVLAREIIENHGGSIALENRRDATGCVARISLPLSEPVG